MSPTRTGAVLNTAFVVLAPDGKTRLTASGRSPRNAFAWPAEETTEKLVAMMKKISRQFPGNGKQAMAQPIPYGHDVRRSLNTAACDNQPLVVVSISDNEKRAELESELSTLTWDSKFSGKFAYAIAGESKDLGKIKGASHGNHVFVVQPGPHGLTGTVLAKTERTDAMSLRRMLSTGLKEYRNFQKLGRNLARASRGGVEWEAADIESRYPNGGPAKKRQSN